MKRNTVIIIFFIPCIYTCIIQTSSFTPKNSRPASVKKNSPTKTTSQETVATKTSTPTIQKQSLFNSWYALKTAQPRTKGAALESSSPTQNPMHIKTQGTNSNNSSQRSLDLSQVSSSNSAKRQELVNNQKIAEQQYQTAAQQYLNTSTANFKAKQTAATARMEAFNKLDAANQALLKQNSQITSGIKIDQTQNQSQNPKPFSALSRSAELRKERSQAKMNNDVTTQDVAAIQATLGKNPTQSKISQNIENIITKIKTSLNINPTKEQVAKVTQTMKKEATLLPKTPISLEVKQFIQNGVDAFKNLNKPKDQKIQTTLNIDGTRTETTRDTQGTRTSTTFNLDGTKQVTTQLPDRQTTSKTYNQKNEITSIIQQNNDGTITTNTAFNPDGSRTVVTKNIQKKEQTTEVLDSFNKTTSKRTEPIARKSETNYTEITAKTRSIL